MTTQPPTTTPQVKEILVGVVMPFSGPAAVDGKINFQGIELAVDEINAQGGVKSLGGAKIKLVIGDSAGDPSTAAREAERLIAVENVVAVVGAYRSADTKTVSEVCERYQTPCLNGDSTSPVLTRRGLQWFSRTTADDDLFAKQHVEFLKHLNTTYPGSIKTVAILHEDSEWGTMSATAWEKYAKEAGFTVVEKISYRSGTPTLDAEVLRLKAANPDVVFLATYLTDAILQAKTFYKYEYLPKIALSQGTGHVMPQFVREVGSIGYYYFSREVFNWDLYDKIPGLKEVNERYKSRYGEDLYGGSVRNYVAMWVLYYALEEAGKVASPTNLQAFRTALRDALRKIDIGKGVFPVPWEGVKFDETGQNIRAGGIIVQLMPDGKWYTVWPPEYATRNYIFPMPGWSQRSSS
jgi:branched-chain amino acid transport system substrate-binding protein